MKIKKKFPHFLVMCVLFSTLIFQLVSYPKAETDTITIGPWTFEDNAFADDATDLSGTNIITVGGSVDCEIITPANFEACLDIALTGYSPDTFLVNVGTDSDTPSNWFQLDFTDLKPINNFGGDIVFFECHFEETSYEFAVRPEGGVFTDFIPIPPAEFQETDAVCNDPTTVWGVALDLSDFGIPAGTTVDAIQFKVLDPAPLDPDVYAEGEPSMAAVITYSEGPPTIYLPLIQKTLP